MQIQANLPVGNNKHMQPSQEIFLAGVVVFQYRGIITVWKRTKFKYPKMLKK